jgi:hypothetical protein
MAFCAKGMSPKQIKVPRDITSKGVCKVFGPIQNKNVHSYVFNEDHVLIAKVERLWMLVHQKCDILALKLISLGFVRGVVMEMKGEKMNSMMFE